MNDHIKLNLTFTYGGSKIIEWIIGVIRSTDQLVNFCFLAIQNKPSVILKLSTYNNAFFLKKYATRIYFEI